MKKYEEFSKEEKGKIIKLKKRGIPSTKIAEILNTSATRVRSFVNENFEFSASKHFWNKDRYEELKQMVLDEKNRIEMAEYFGKSERAIEQKLLIYFGSSIVSKAKETIISYGDADLYF